jgi:hypothetical protein
MFMAIIAGVALAVSIPIAMSIAMCQPGVHPGNVGILSGLDYDGDGTWTSDFTSCCWRVGG